MKKSGETWETIVIFVALLSLMPVVVWWHTGDLPSQRSQFFYWFYVIFYLLLVLCAMGYVTYRRVKRLRSALKASKKRGSGPPVSPFFR